MIVETKHNSFMYFKAVNNFEKEVCKTKKKIILETLPNS